MLKPDDAQVILRLHRQGWGTRRIAKELGIARNTVRRYLDLGQWQPRPSPERPGALDGLEDWLRQQFLKHHGNAAVVLQELQKHHGREVSLRTVQRAVEHLRLELERQARATVRFETAPGQQMQADFGERYVTIAGEKVKVHLAVLTLGYSRRCYVEAFTHERRQNWLLAIEHAIERFGGVTDDILVDNARALVKVHDTDQNIVEFDPVFLDFCTFWGMKPKACRPYRARTKGKVENGVGYVKKNALAGHEFDSWAHMQAHLAWWMDEVSDVRIHGTTGEKPLVRFDRDEKEALAPFPNGRFYPVLLAGRRKVKVDACVEVDTNHYSVPWGLIGRMVSVRLDAHHLVVLHKGEEVARHARGEGRKERYIHRPHLQGMPNGPSAEPVPAPERPAEAVVTSSLQRPLAEYGQLVELLGGGS